MKKLHGSFKKIKKNKSMQFCHAANDGECIWKNCPQLRDGEPEKSNRSCPLHWLEDDEV